MYSPGPMELLELMLIPNLCPSLLCQSSEQIKTDLGARLERKNLFVRKTHE